ncbi:MAG: regulatory protein NosR [Alphaproteobacteria bacterium]|nr:regulatory protein NosR [Alphaproteobacteria bacterium]
MPRWIRLLLVLAAVAMAAPAAWAQVDAETLAEVFPAARRIGPIEGNPPAAIAYDGERALGFVLFSHAVIGSLGYSGKPIDIAVGLTQDGRIAGARLMRHQEPILVLGIGEAALHRFVAEHRGLDIRAPVAVAAVVSPAGKIDAIAGATVSSLLLREAILRSARAVARSRGIGTTPAAAGAIDLDRFEVRDWDALREEGAVVQLRLTGADVARRRGEDPAVPAEILFVDLHAALATPAGIGRNLLGDRQFNDLVGRLADGEQALLLAANGLYSFKGSGFVRSGRFDRIRLVQGERTITLETSMHRRLESLGPGMPAFREIGLFVLPAAAGFDATAPWSLELVVDAADPQRGPAVFARGYTLPARFLRAGARAAEEEGSALWERVWQERMGRVVVCLAALASLTLLLFAQDRLAKFPVSYKRIRLAFLVFTLGWLGLYATAQLSVVNILTFAQALLTGFRWDFFLLEPVIFLLWGFVAVALLFWGRGVFCGWLCPFGALQDLAFRVGRWLKLPALRLPFVVHERLAALKYVGFLAIFALSLNFTAQALAVAEIEPFKTTFALRFARPWPFIVYVVLLVAAGLVLERGFCRYLCPLGAGLAIPARLRLFEWLKRKKQCGTECQICASRCPVQAIHPDGRINPNECIYCLNCQLLYYDATTCPPLIARRQRREARGPGAAAAAAARVPAAQP